MKFLETLIELSLPLLMARIIDQGIKTGNTALIIHTALWMLVIILIGYLSAFLGQYYAAVAAQGMGMDMRMDMIDRIHRFSFQELDSFGASTLINRVTNDVNQVVTAVNMFIRLILRAPFICLGALTLSLYVSVQMSMIFAALIPIFILILWIISRVTVPRFRLVQRALDFLAGILRENFSGVRVIRAFVQQKAEKKRVFDATDDLANQTIRVNNISALLSPLTTLVVNFGILLILGLGGWQIYHGWMLQGDLVALINYITLILLALIIVSNLISLLAKAAASFDRIQMVRHTKPTIQDPKESKRAEKSRGGKEPVLAFHKVTFSYPGGAPVLSGIDFQLEAGKTLGVIGITGSGKSTLIHLIPRFYDPVDGEVLWEGTPVSQWSLQALRQQMGLAPQKSVLFSGSIADNLRFSKPDAIKEEMIQALKDAQAYSFVEKMPQGLQSEIYEGGKNLSGGQKQRLCIARALLRRPKLLILDDSLSALDASTAQAISKTLRESYSDMAVIIISQRISAVAGADAILVLEEGKQVGLASHSELLASCDVYREIFDSQMCKEEAV